VKSAALAFRAGLSGVMLVLSDGVARCGTEVFPTATDSFEGLGIAQLCIDAVFLGDHSPEAFDIGLLELLPRSEFHDLASL
jgi:hypothetical protein